MKWYNDMTEQETRSFRKVIVVCTVGIILILIVPMVFMLFSKQELTSHLTILSPMHKAVTPLEFNRLFYA